MQGIIPKCRGLCCIDKNSLFLIEKEA